jgi:hypothetical protein
LKGNGAATALYVVALAIQTFNMAQKERLKMTHKLVPIELTEEMDEAARKVCHEMQGCIDPVQHVWEAILKHAPSVESEPVALRAMKITWQDDSSYEWSNADWGFSIFHDEGKYYAAWGEGDSEAFNTFDDASACCQKWADDFIAKTTTPPSESARIANLEAKLNLAREALQKIWDGTGSNFNAQMCAVEALKQIGEA